MRSTGVVVVFPGSAGRRVYNGRTMPPAPEPIDRPTGPIRLCEWVLYPDRRLLESDDDSRRLEPKAVDVLALLVARAGDVVSKDELIDRVWESRIISEGTLTNTIAELRQALGDDAREPRFIETIPKRGYRLACPVEDVGGHAVGGDSTPTALRKPWPTAAAIALVVSLAVAAVIIWSRPPTLEPDRILATPFVNRTGEPELGPYATLARDRILSGLAESGIARPVSADDATGAATIDEVCRTARSHGAALAVTGALYLHEGEVEVQTRLVDVAEGELLYAASPVIGPRSEITASVDEAVNRILGALATHLYAHAHSSLLSRPPVFEAYREFIAGSEIYTDDLGAAVRHLERAVEIDPEFTSANLRLAMGYKAAGRGPEGRSVLDRLEARRGELTEFERLWLDAFIANFDGRWEDTLSALRSVRTMASRDWTVLFLIGQFEMLANHPNRAVEAFGQLHDADLPDFVMRHGLYAESYRLLAAAHHQIGDEQTAIAAADAGLERFPTDAGLMAAKARSCAALGNVDCLEHLIAAADGTSGQVRPENLMVAAAASAAAHDRVALASDLAARAVDFHAGRVGDETSGNANVDLARAFVLLGRLDRAQVVLEEAVASFDEQPVRARVGALGWLGAIAARRGDLAAAGDADRELTALDDPYLYGLAEYYRAAIAAWSGRRDQALELLRQARSRGFGGFHRLHDDERVLFEPLEGEEAYRAMLEPVD
jgi:DNA-binding winged helix-turn-helix (wHTH) protein/tetratricopeptide (TPR) repeat protein